MTYTYTDSIARVYVDIIDLTTGGALFAEPGKSYDLAADPADGRWTTEAPQTAPEAPVAPADPITESTPAN